MRYVFLAKNLFNILLAGFEVVAVYAAISYMRNTTPPLQMTISVLLWAAFTLLVSMAVGNRRSITAPKKIDPQKPAGKQASALSGLLSIGMMLVAAGIGAGVYLLALYFGQAWIVPAAAVVLAAIGAAIYMASLATLDTLLADNRETLIEQLCKTG
jgi:ABC-2 type transport system permease protein